MLRLARKTRHPAKSFSQNLKKAATRGTKLAVGRELTKSNFAPFQLFEDKNHTDLSVSKPDRRRTSVNRRSGQAISNLLDPRVESSRYIASAKKVDCSILRFESGESRGMVSSGRTLLRKISKYFDPRDTKVLFEEKARRKETFRISDLANSQMIMRQSFFFGNHNGIGPEEREYITDTIIDFLDAELKR
jgi:hypothetical protein